jgi:hypothetical protein
MREKYEARALLIQLYKFRDTVRSTNKPYVASWGAAEEARFIRSLVYKSRKIDEAVSGILAKIANDDYLALACMDRLISQEYDEQIRNYCERRIPRSNDFADELRLMLNRINSRNAANTQPVSSANASQPIRAETKTTSSPAGSHR